MTCQRCTANRARIGWCQGDLAHAARAMVRSQSTKNAEALAEARKQLDSAREVAATHLRECQVVVTSAA